jgi:hypothetical protein
MNNKQTMPKFKKIWLFLLGIVVIFGINLQYVQWLPIRDHQKTYYSQELDRPSDWKVDGEEIDEKDSLWQWRKVVDDMDWWIINVSKPDEYNTWLWYALTLIQIAINRILGMLSFVTLIYLIYNWFLVFSAWSDNKNVEKWKKGIRTAAIALAWIALSWLIISLMLWLIKSLA